MAITKSEMKSILVMRIWSCEQEVDKLKEKLNDVERYLRIARKQLRNFRKEGE